MYPFEQFTERGRNVLTLAQQEAVAAGHSYIGTEHLLIGILREEKGLGCVVLQALGVELEATRAAIATVLGEPRIIQPQIIPTSRVKKVIELSFETARQMGHAYVGTEHLVLGLLTEGEGIAARVLIDMGVTLERVRAEIDRKQTEGAGEPYGSRPTFVQRHFTSQRPMAPDVVKLMGAASRVADSRGSTLIGLDHLLDAMISSAGMEALARLLDVRRHAAAKEQAIASQDYEAAAGHRTAERRARQALDEAVAAWRQELVPPPGEEAS